MSACETFSKQSDKRWDEGIGGRVLSFDIYLLYSSVESIS